MRGATALTGPLCARRGADVAADEDVVLEQPATGHVLFSCAERRLAAPLEEVLEVVRAVGVEPLSGSRAPVTGTVELRGMVIPVVDLRSGNDVPGKPRRGDVLVLVPDEDGPMALAVDAVLSVHAGDELVLDDAPLPHGLPVWVDGVLRRFGGGAPILRVQLRRLAGLDTSVDLTDTRRQR